MTFDVSIQTLLYRHDGSLLDDVIVRRCGVDQSGVDWLAGSCKTTAFWLIGFDEATGPEWYTLKYRTVVMDGDRLVSDTTLLEFPHLTYADMRRFEAWAIDQLREMREVFAVQHGPEPTRRRSKVKTVVRSAWQVLKNRMCDAR